jgi:signal transduction histidine kinase
MSTDDRFVRISESVGGIQIAAEYESPKQKSSSRLFAEADSTVWMSSGETLLRYSTSKGGIDLDGLTPIVNSVSSVGSDSMLVSGSLAEISNLGDNLSFLYRANDIEIEYSSIVPGDNKSLTYSHHLDGRSKSWSAWSSQKSVTFTNLREGKYTFRVKARNDFGKETPEASFSFVILPPWYRTTLAYIAYLLSIGIFGFLSTKYYQLAVANRKAKEQAIELAREKVVNEKLQEANYQLHVVNERLTVVNALKDEFLATTSHELRTPITAIQGYAAILKEELDGPHSEFADIIDSSSQRLMSTLNAVLDLAKLRSGAIDLFPVDTNLQEFCAAILDAHREKAAAKQLVLETNFTTEELRICIDQYSLRIIVSNVLDNAIKFSDTGIIRLSIDHQDHMAVVTIQDEGIGIGPEFLPHVFDEFRQESETLSRERDGSGLGLSIASRMMDLLNGAIDVQSQVGIGTVVKLSFQFQLQDTKLVRESDRQALSRDHTVRTSSQQSRPA